MLPDLPEGFDFVHGNRLWLLLGVLALAVAFAVVDVRRRRSGRAYADPALLAAVAPRRPGWRAVPGQVLVLLSLAAMVVAFAEPEALADDAREKAVVIVALDVSGSMLNTDIAPNRFEVAKDGVRGFVEGLPDEVDVGLVTFAGTASLTTPATSDHSAVIGALDGLVTAGGTAQGDAILLALGEIQRALPRTAPGETPAARIVVLSDGSSPSGTPVPIAASKAVELSVPVSTIAVGTNGTGRNAFEADEMRMTAEVTGGIAYEANDIDTLDGVYADIGSQLEEETKREPLSSLVMLTALIVLLLGVLPTVLLVGRLP